MIKEYLINIECKLADILNYDGPDHVIICEIIESYIDLKYLTDDNPDVKKVMPFLLSMYDGKYFEVGISIGKIRDIGKHYKSTNPNK